MFRGNRTEEGIKKMSQQSSLLLWAETDHAPPLDPKKTTRADEISRLEKKADDIRECLAAFRALGDRCQARLDVLEREIVKLKKTV